MAECASCGKDVPGDFPFCPFCAAPLTASAPAPSGEERKVVSVLFCDLVGFTAASEAADPEDVRARLRPYHERVRLELERYGGTVEKFIGDAVMAVFGAPVSHEDDAERAVRAGLRVLRAIEELNERDARLDLRVRVGIDTGEAVVDRAARPERGEGFVTGDVVNTAARLQSVAHVGGVAVGEATHRLTERVFVYEQREPVTVKGKAAPVECWRPLSAHARLGSDVTRTHATPLVGRTVERPLLIAAFEQAARQRACRLVTIVGEPGMGKSRLCMELLAELDDAPGLVRWRQGRCLPYGDGISFWALGEIVKAECGILESDSPREAEAKLARTLSADDPDLPWLKARLGPLVGVGGEPASQEESFAAWRRFCESMAAAGPAVLVFEDLHWADQALLSFLEHLADRAEDVPLLVLCTARPELQEQHPGWAGGLRNATTIKLSPLTDEETARLIGSLLERVVLPAETQASLLERAGGNPLYAEEFVRLLSDRGELGEAVEVPESVQALIAARLDILSAERKSLLQDASVVGKVFWAGAVAEMGGRDPREVEVVLHELSRRELVRPAATSSMEGEAEYGFWHLLVRDVSYSQIPRVGRAARHQAVAAWLEGKAGERAEDLADVLAYHFLQALELNRAAGQTDQTAHLEERTRRYLTLAGERALPLDVNQSEQHFARALDLAPTGHPDRARLLEHWAQAALQQGRHEEARVALEEALAHYRDQREDLACGGVLTLLALTRWRLGDPRQQETLVEALALLEAEPPGPALVTAYAHLAGLRYVHAANQEAITAAERALALAEDLRLPEPAAALGTRGVARCYLGDRQGAEDMHRALQLALEQGQGRTAANLHNNLTIVSWMYEGPRAALEAAQEGIDFSQRRGINEFALQIAVMSPTFLAQLGHPEQALAEAEPIADRSHAVGSIDFIEPRSVQIRLLTERGDHDHAPDPDDLLVAARDSGEPQLIAQAFAAAAELLRVQRQPQQAQQLLRELDQTPDIRADPYYASLLPGLVRSALSLGDRDLAERLVDGVPPATPLAEQALAACRARLAQAAADDAQAAQLYQQAAERSQEFGNVPERAYALLGQGRSLLSLGHAGAEVPLTEARDLFASMGYKPALAETEKLLTGTVAETA